MGFGSFLRGIVAQVNPWDNGKTYGSYNPAKKKLEPGDPGYVAPRPTPAPNSNPLQSQNQGQNVPKPQTPQNLFAGLNNNLKLPGAPQTTIPVTNTPSTIPGITPAPGTIIKPTIQPTSQAPAVPVPHGMVAATVDGTRVNHNGQTGVMATNKVTGQPHFVPDAPAPQKPTGFWGHVGNGFKTAGQTVVGTVSNVPEVALATGRAATGIVQGVTQLPHVVTAGAATATQKVANNFNNPVTRQINRGFQDVNTGTKNVTTVVNKPIDAVNRTLDRAATGYANAVPTAYGGAQAYKATQIPINVLAALLTAGTSAGAEGAGAAGEAGQTGRIGQVVNKFQELLNKPLTSNTDNIVSKTSQAISNKTTPVVQALNTPFSSTKNAATRVFGRQNPNVVNVERGLVDAGESGQVMNGVEDITKPPTQIQVQQPQTIDVNAPPSEPTTIPVTNNNPTPTPGKPIVEVGGDRPGSVRVPTQEEVAAQRATNNFNNQAPGRPDESVGGVFTDPRKIITKADKAEVQQTLDDKLATNQITADEHKALSDELGKVPAADAPSPTGRKIQVKQVEGIPVQNRTDVPQGLPETPGTVRATEQSAPNNAQSQAIANTPQPVAPEPLPKEVQAVLDNPKQYNKRQVAAARNQRKLARQLAKTKEDTQAAVSRMDSASPIPTSDEGLVPTGQFDKSANGGSYQVASRNAEMNQAKQETSQMAPKDAISTARANQTATGGFNPRDIRNIRAMFETKRIPRGTPEWNEARQILKEDGTLHAQSLALRGGTIFRRTASPTELMSQYESKIYRLANDPSKIDSKSLDDVEAATTKFTDARDAATAANNRFTESPTTANAKAYHAAQDAADQADKEAKMTEYKVAQKVLKGNKDAKQVRELQKMAQDSDMYQMDGIDASMLSGTGTFARNVVNSAIGGTEEGLLGGIGSRVAKFFTGENVGGGVGRGTLSGFGKGTKNVVDASKARASDAGWNPLSHIKNWATTGNQLGDSIIDSQVTHNVLDHYTQMLKDQGYKGRELNDRASVMARQDPDNLTHTYQGYAKAAAGLGSGIAKGSKIETIVKNAISDSLSFGNPNQASETAAKLITRMTVGFPSAVGRTIAEGAKRTPIVGQLYDGAKIITAKDSAARALAIKEAIKHGGTAAATSAIFYHLGQNGTVTGSYPTDPAERARWQREGITENSIKIDGNYYQLPSYLGSAALPALFAATLGRNNGDVAKTAGEVAKGIPAILPTDQASNVLDAINQRTDPKKFAIQTAASATRALTPAGALLNQISKSFDPTANDTTTGTALNQFVDKVVTGIPGQNKFANIPDKTDDQGNVIHNPGALPLAFGASSTTQDKGVQETQNINDKVNTDLKSMQDVGAFNDPTLKSILDDKTLKIYNDVNSGKQATPADLKKLHSALTKGVPTNGDDTAYLERGQYDTNLTALNLKRNEMAADPTTKPSELAKIDLNIKRGQVYKDNKIPYTDITDYKGTSLADWRAMGDDTSDKYDPAMYQKLWDMDQLMAKAGASDNTKDPTAGKFSAKAPGKSRGSGIAGGFSGDFGKLGNGLGAPSVQQYQTINQSAGQIPAISVVRPNIVHKISSSG